MSKLWSLRAKRSVVIPRCENEVHIESESFREQTEALKPENNSSNNAVSNEIESAQELPDSDVGLADCLGNTSTTCSNADSSSQEKSSTSDWTVTKILNLTSFGSQQLTFLHSANISIISKKASFQVLIDLLANKTAPFPSNKVFLFSEHEEPRMAVLSNKPIHPNE